VRTIICLIISIAWTSFSFAQEVAHETAKWKVKSKESEGFAKIYTLRPCQVAVRSDGSGLVLSASESQGSDSITTSIRILREQPPNVLSTRMTKEGLFVVPRLGQERQPDVFLLNCLDRSKRLPPDVRKLFNGYGGIK
jgi:hypothetical protein